VADGAERFDLVYLVLSGTTSDDVITAKALLFVR